MAAVVATVAALGIYMVRLPNAGFNANKIILILIHKETQTAVAKSSFAFE